MNLSPDSAKTLAAQLEEASALCDQSLRVVKANEGLGVLQVYARLVGLFLGHSYTNILAPLWGEHPELEPAQMKEPYVEPVPTLSPESQASIAAFLSSVKPVLSQLESLLAATDAGSSLPYGGVAEVVHSVADIERFFNNPRFHDASPQATHEP